MFTCGFDRSNFSLAIASFLKLGGAVVAPPRPPARSQGIETQCHCRRGNCTAFRYPAAGVNPASLAARCLTPSLCSSRLAHDLRHYFLADVPRGLGVLLEVHRVG